MKISHFAIRNCARFDDIDVSVGEHLVLVGPNGSGKSSLLRLLDATMSWTRGRLQSELDHRFLRDQGQPLSCTVILDDLDTDEFIAFADEVELVQPTNQLRLTIQLTATVSPQEPDELEISRAFVKTGVQPIQVTGSHLRNMSWNLLRADRHAERELSSTGSGAVAQLLRAAGLGADEDAVVTALDAVDVALDGAKSLQQLRSDVAAALTTVFPEDVVADQVTIKLSGGLEPLRTVDINVDRGLAPFKLLEQSDGMRALSVMSLQILSASDSAITAIDEPEVHLHPRSQARVSRLFAKPGGQRLIATHSPTVVRSFHPSHVVALTPYGPRQLGPAVVASNTKFFSNWWVENMIEPLTSRSLILVEGLSDVIITHAVARLRGIDLDREDISVVGLGSAFNFPAAYKMFGREGFGIAVSSLVDDNEKTEPATALGVAVDQLDAHDVIVCIADLEAEYIAAVGGGRVVQILLGSGHFGGVTDANVLARCSKQKVRAALALSDAITRAEAELITPVVTLIDRALAKR